MRIVSVAVAALAAAAMAAPAAAATGGDVAKPPVVLTARLPAGARLGAESPVRLGLRIDPRRLPVPVRELRLRFPASLGIATSGLGAAACRRTDEEFAAVMIRGSGLAGCSPNAVMGRGTARAEVRFGPSSTEGPITIPELARVSMLAAPFDDGQFGLLFLANGIRPFGVTLAYNGRIEPAPAPWGGALTLLIAPVPNEFDAEIALIAIAFEIGAPEIRYRERRGGRTTWYRPEGIVLPQRCPRGAFPFDAELTFADGTRRSVATTMRCPKRAARR
jgi:hypothetical protein